MRHGVNHVIHSDTNSKRGIFLRIVRVVRPLPGIADIRIESHGDHDAAVIVVDAAPVRHGASLIAITVRGAALQSPLSGDLITVVEIVNDVEDRVVVGDFDDLRGRGRRAACFPQSGSIPRFPRNRPA